MSNLSKLKNGVSRRSLLKGAAGAVGLAAGSGAIPDFPMSIPPIRKSCAISGPR
jgi:TAT (twin-arginine translocation) pathway signal sequence.